MSKRDLDRLLGGLAASDAILSTKRISKRPDGTSNRRAPNSRDFTRFPTQSTAPQVAQDATVQGEEVQDEDSEEEDSEEEDRDADAELTSTRTLAASFSSTRRAASTKPSARESTARTAGQHPQECELCAELLPPQELCRLARCEHEAEICRACFADWLKTQVDDAVVERLECPSSVCHTVFDYGEVQEHASEATFER